MYKMKTNEYADVLRRCFDAKSPLYVYGGPGIGKSAIPRQVFKEVAEKQGKTFLSWNEIDRAVKDQCIADPDKYFIFCDQRVAQMDTTDLRGIPSMVNTEMLETIPMSWVIYFTQPKAHGVIFFDELNLAAPAVSGQAYQIINEREIADRRIGDDVFVFGAGNRTTDMAHVFTMPFPLRDRFNEFEVGPDIKAWTEWAVGKVNPHLISFVNWKDSYLYKVDKNAANKSSTPRGIKRASDLIGDMDITSNATHAFISIAVGEGFATEFLAYCKHFQSLQWDTIYKSPKTVSEFDIDKLWAVVGGMSEQFNKFKGKAKTEQSMFDKMMRVVMCMKTDFAVVTLKMFKETDEKKFAKYIKNCDRFEEIVDQYAKYIAAV